MRDYSIYSENKDLKAVVIGRVLFTYVRPKTKYQRSDIVPAAKPKWCKSFDEAKRKAKRYVTIH